LSRAGNVQILIAYRKNAIDVLHNLHRSLLEFRRWNGARELRGSSADVDAEIQWFQLTILPQRPKDPRFDFDVVRGAIREGWQRCLGGPYTGRKTEQDHHEEEHERGDSADIHRCRIVAAQVPSYLCHDLPCDEPGLNT